MGAHSGRELCRRQTAEFLSLLFTPLLLAPRSHHRTMCVQGVLLLSTTRCFLRMHRGCSKMRVLCLGGMDTNVDLNTRVFKRLLEHLGGEDAVEFTFLDGTTKGLGGVYRWWNASQRGDNKVEYEGVEDALMAIQDTVLKQSQPFDVLLGFSQGGALSLIAQGLCQGTFKGCDFAIPSHKRWKSTVVLNGFLPRDPRFCFPPHSLTEWHSPTLVVYDPRDSVLAKANLVIQDTQESILNATWVKHSEGHRTPKSMHVLDKIKLSMTRSAQHKFYCFDFDGVVCDSCRELCTAGWKTARSMGWVKKCMESELPDQETYAKFLQVRPVLETGYESIILLYRLLDLNESPQSILEQGSVQNIMAHVTVEELKSQLQKTREEWMKEDFEGWLNIHSFYEPIVSAMQELIRQNKDVYVITTKHARLARALLDQREVVIPQDRLFGLGSGPKHRVLDDIVQRDQLALGASGVFIEDRVDTLRLVASQAKAPLELILAGYGYNTEQERVCGSMQDGFRLFPSCDQLSRYLLVLD